MTATGLTIKPTNKDKGSNQVKQLESLKDEGPQTRTSLSIDADKHRRYKIYLLQQGKSLREDFTDYIDKCIKDIK